MPYMPTDPDDLQRTDPNNKIVVKDGATVLAEGVEVNVAAGGATKTLSVQKVDNGDSDVSAGSPAENVMVSPSGILVLDTYGGPLDAGGKLDFVVGPFDSGSKGCMKILIWNDSGEGLGYCSVNITVGS